MADANASRTTIASFVLLGGAIAAMIVANSPAGYSYKGLLAAEVGFDIGPFDLSYPVKEWVKNALMTVFFLLVGLEIKAEFMEGALADRRRATLPFAGAIGGMAAPAIVYLSITSGRPEIAMGWAIPSATDSPSRSAWWGCWARPSVRRSGPFCSRWPSSTTSAPSS
jgi:Na+:H+ antiporter, NhaA family